MGLRKASGPKCAVGTDEKKNSLCRVISAKCSNQNVSFMKTCTFVAKRKVLETCYLLEQQLLTIHLIQMSSFVFLNAPFPESHGFSHHLTTESSPHSLESLQSTA